MKINLSIPSKEMADMQKAISRLSTEKRKQIKFLTGDIAKNAAADAKDKAPRNVGNLKRNVRHEVLIEHGGLEITGRITSGAEYSSAVEFGRSPGTMPPIESKNKPDEGILYWVRRKGIARSWSIKTRRMTKATNAQKQAEVSMAWAIAKKIERFGTQPQPFMRPAYERWNKVFETKLKQILRA